MRRNNTCDWCGKVFQTRWGTESYCSDACRDEIKAHSEAARTRRGKGGNHRPRHVNGALFMGA